jgi:hypothetical protein
MQGRPRRQKQLQLSWDDLRADEKSSVQEAYCAGASEKAALHDKNVISEIERLQEAFAGLSGKARSLLHDAEYENASQKLIFELPHFRMEQDFDLNIIVSRMKTMLAEKHVLDEIQELYEALNALSEVTRRLLYPHEDIVARWEGDPLPPGVMARLEGEARAWLGVMRPRDVGRPNEIAHQYAVAELSRIYEARGGSTRKGRLHADRKPSKGGRDDPFSPNPFTQFLADALRFLDPRLRSPMSAARAAHSAIDAINRHAGHASRELGKRE